MTMWIGSVINLLGKFCFGEKRFRCIVPYISIVRFLVPVNGTLLAVSHLLFTDNTILFCDATANHLLYKVCASYLSKNIYKVSDSLFQSCYRFKSFYGKEWISPSWGSCSCWGVAALLCHKMGSLPITSLGLLLASLKATWVRRTALERMERRLVGWLKSTCIIFIDK